MPRPTVHFTILRDPVERVISAYYHVRRSTTHPLHEAVVSANISLSDFITSGIAQAEIENGQTRILSGIEGVDWVTGSGPISLGTLETAKRNLKNQFTVFGLAERFDESMLLLANSLGWSSNRIVYQKRNVGSNRPSNKSLPRDLTALIEQYNELDIQLYEFAKNNFAETLRELGLGFVWQLQTFRVLNALHPIASRARQKAGSIKRKIWS